MGAEEDGAKQAVDMASEYLARKPDSVRDATTCGAVQESNTEKVAFALVKLAKRWKKEGKEEEGEEECLCNELVARVDVSWEQKQQPEKRE